MNFELGKFWMGTPESLDQYVINMAMAMKHGYAPQSQAQEKEGSRLLTVQNGVAVVSIRGSLTNAESGYGSYTTSYPEIRDAMIQAAADPSVKAVLMDINSGGGSVTGVSDTAKLIRSVDGIKPVYAYTDGLAASAAYWLGSSARAVYSSEMAELGSIGVITVHQSYARLYQEMGIDATVIRSGEFKSLGHPLEPLSDKAKAVIQDQLDQMYDMFAGYVADRRGMTLDNFNKTAGEGRVFIGQKAVEAGLSDGVTSFDKLMSKIEMDTQPAQPMQPQPRPFRASATSLAVDAALSAEGGIAFSENLLQSGANQSQGPAVKTALTDQQIAALAEGAALTGDTPTAEAPATQTTEPAAETSAPATPEADAAQAATSVQADAVVTLLQAQLAEANSKVVDLTVELRGVKAELDGAKAASAGFRSIAQASVDRMKVALGMPSGIAAATDEALMSEHTSLRSTFEAKFKAGGVAAVSAAAPTEGAPSQPDPARQARIHATRLK